MRLNRQSACWLLGFVLFRSVNGQEPDWETQEVLKQFRQSKRTAVVVGIEAYPTRVTGWDALSFAKDDAIELSQALREQGYDVETLTDAEVEREDFIKTLVAQARKATGGTFVLFYAGHGARVGDVDYLVTMKTTKSSIGTFGIEVNQAVDAIRKTGVRQTIIFIDACRTQSPNHGGGSRGSTSLDPIGPLEARGAWILNSTQVGAPSYELREIQHGAFAYHLIRAIRGAAEQRGIVRFDNLAALVMREVPMTTSEMSPVQRPMMSTREARGNPVLAVKSFQKTSALSQVNGKLTRGAFERIVRMCDQYNLMESKYVENPEIKQLENRLGQLNATTSTTLQDIDPVLVAQFRLATGQETTQCPPIGGSEGCDVFRAIRSKRDALILFLAPTLGVSLVPILNNRLTHAFELGEKLVPIVARGVPGNRLPSNSMESDLLALRAVANLLRVPWHGDLVGVEVTAYYQRHLNSEHERGALVLGSHFVVIQLALLGMLKSPEQATSWETPYRNSALTVLHTSRSIGLMTPAETFDGIRVPSLCEVQLLVANVKQFLSGLR